MGSRTYEVFLQNRSGIRVQTSVLTSFAANVRRHLKLRGEVAVLLCNDHDIRRMNKWFRGKDKTTDVLSFPSEIRGHAGDIAISAETADVNAKRLRLSRIEELKILLLHGMLHLAGYDHESDNGEMSKREATLRKRFGLSQSLIDRTHRATERKTVRKR
jgi:probable rRNA maturation factor